jgi:uncharacterized RDD family membrane protein YckC
MATTTSTSTILVGHNDKQLGPFSKGQVQDMLDSGAFQPDDLYWEKGMPEWLPLSHAFSSGAPPPMPRRTGGGSGGAATPYRPNQAQYNRVSGDEEYAGFWRRFAGVFIDGIILAIPAAGITGLIAAGGAFNRFTYYGSQSYQYFDSGAFNLTMQGISIVLTWLYVTTLESSKGQGTLGQRALGIKVTDEDGNRISWLHANGRHFSKLISSLTLGIGYLMCAWTERKQCLHDKISSCLVVKR